MAGNFDTELLKKQLREIDYAALEQAVATATVRRCLDQLERPSLKHLARELLRLDHAHLTELGQIENGADADSAPHKPL